LKHNYHQQIDNTRKSIGWILPEMKSVNLKQLNKEQKKAVQCVDKPVLLLAGAGSGKTRVITYRIAHLISNCNVPPFQVLALTFTNKAAKEMNVRVRKMLGDDTHGVTITTFHALCVRFLRLYIHLLGYHKDFVIFDTANQQSTIKTIYDDEGIDGKEFSLKAVHSQIMKVKGEGKGPEEFLQQRNNPYNQTIGKIFSEYNKALKGCNALDFEDILYLTIDLFKRFPNEVRSLQERYDHIMIDEYQDTNHVQYQLTKFLTAYTRNLCVVGDDDQSIYSWRGADIRNILDFQNDFPEAEVIRLEQNYRSTSVILNAANDVIAHNRERMAKSLWTNAEEGDQIRWIEEDNPKEELAEVLNWMRVYKNDNGRTWSEFAFLYRSNFQSRVIEELLREEGIPYQLIGGTKFFDRKEIQDCLAYMRFLHNTRDEISLFRVINHPKRDIGKNTLVNLTQNRIKRGLSLFEMMEQVDDIDELKPRARKSVHSFVDLINEFKEKLAQAPFYDVFREFFERVGLRTEIERTEKVDQIREMRVNNFLEFLNSLYLYGERRGTDTEDATLTDYLEYVSLFTDTDDLELQSGKVSLMTVHSAKGLEFEYVALVGMTDGQFPNHNSIDEDNLEEERRLFYVAVTRAMKYLSLSMPRTRMMYGEWIYNEPSRFIAEIEAERFRNPPMQELDPWEQEYRAAKARQEFFRKRKEW